MSKRSKQSHRTLSLLFVLGGVLFIMAVWFGVRVLGSGVYADVVTLATTKTELMRHPLTGEALSTTANGELEFDFDVPWVYALMIDNSIDAWPQRGVDQAFLVIEALAEGRIPRFVAFYSSDQSVEVIGPIRSARPYFIDWASGFSALFAHVGGSPAALDELEVAVVFDFNQYYLDEYFWRSYWRYAPHNVYTSTDLLGKGLATMIEEGKVPSYEYWQFKDDALVESRVDEAVNATVDFGTDEYFVEWKYDSDLNAYVRFQGGSQMIMEDGAEIIANNVIVIKTDISVIDAIGRRETRTIGEGSAEVYQDGTAVVATWEKESQDKPLKFFDEAGLEIKMNAGVTWIEVIE